MHNPTDEGYYLPKKPDEDDPVMIPVYVGKDKTGDEVNITVRRRDGNHIWQSPFPRLSDLEGFELGTPDDVGPIPLSGPNGHDWYLASWDDGPPQRGYLFRVRRVFGGTQDEV